MHQGLEGVDHQAGTDQQNQGESHLHDDQRLARAMAFAALAQGSSALAQIAIASWRRQYLITGIRPMTRLTKSASAEGEEQHRAIDADFVEAGQAGGFEATRARRPQRPWPAR